MKPQEYIDLMEIIEAMIDEKIATGDTTIETCRRMDLQWDFRQKHVAKEVV